ncbi:hypothetical protein AAG906_013398 [Vitis piasezkii]
MAFSSSASSNVIFAPPNIGHLVSIKLSDTNYLIWSSQIVPVLKSHDLMGFVDGSEPCPSKSLDERSCVLSWINATLSDKVLASAYGITSRSRGVEFSSKQVCLSIQNPDKNVSFEDFQAELLSYELLLENQNIAIPPETNNFAFFTPKSNQQQYNRKPKNPSKPYSRPSFSQNPRPRYSPQPSGLPSSPQPNQKQHSFSTPKSPCQICGKLSHKALDCFHRMDYAYQGRHPPTQLAAMVAHSNAEQEEETWFADSGANQHITANLEHLTLQQPYTGQENVAVGNGQGLSIAHTGTTIFHTPEAKLNLKRVLHCPQASANLLSINQFCLDNNCLFILTGTHYFVKDIQTGATLLEGRSEGGLYPIQLRSMSINKSHALSAVVGIKAPVSVWHSRLGHASLPIVSQLLNKHLYCYSSHQNGYRCLDPVTQKVLISRHVVFNENTFPAKDGLQSSNFFQNLYLSPLLLISPLYPLPYRSSSYPFYTEFSSSSNHFHHPMITRSQTATSNLAHFQILNSIPPNILSKHYPDRDSLHQPLPTSCFITDCVLLREEYDALLANETWKLCPRPVDHNVVGNKWVQLDVSNAFLHGILLEDVYMEQPKGFVNSDFPDYVCKLNKSLYGLKQAPLDASLFVYHKGHIHLFILIYVDDILVTGTDPSLIQSLIQKLQTEFKMKDLGPLGYFLGIQASRDSSGLHLRQSKYIGDLLHRTKMAGAKPASSPCTTGLKLSTHVGEPLTASQITEYRQTVGALQYCTLTRPDIAFSVNQLCQHMHCPNSVHWTAAKRVLRYLKGTIDLGLWYTKGEQTLQAFCDSDWAGNPDDRRSTTGYGVFFGSCLISWTAKKQSVVARSSTEAEYRALAITTAELYWIRMLLKELHISLPTAPTIWCDNSGALALAFASNPCFMPALKHIEVDFHFIRERDDNHNIQTTEISSTSHLSYPHASHL